MDTPQELLPKGVRRMTEALREDGFAPQVQLAGEEWEVFIAGEHVRASAFYGRKPGNPRTRFLRGELLVDGVTRPPATSFEELHEIWDEHELGVPPASGLLEVTAPGHEAVPGPVQRAAEDMRRLSREKLNPWCGRTRRGWAVALDFGPGSGLRLLFERNGTLARDPVQLFIDGEDRSADAGGRVDKALALLAGHANPVAGTPEPGMAAASAARDTGVETRKMVVKRILCPDCPHPGTLLR